MIRSEEQFIDFISKNYESINKIPSQWLGVGDDAAIFNINSEELLFCADAVVENIHFRPSNDFFDVGWKSIVSNQSDLAAMGGYPIAFTVTLGINKNTSEEQLIKLYKGMDSACKNYGGKLLGGDIVKSETLFISVSAIGRNFINKKTMRRSNAKLNDVVAVTGEIGNSIAGLEMVDENKNISNKQTEKFLKPIPRFKESKLAIETGIICAMDLSDGLEKDLKRISKSSNVEIEVEFEKIKYDDSIKEYFGNDFEDKIITSGEEYELILIGPASKIKSLNEKIDLSIIGKVTGDTVSRVNFYKNGKKLNITSESFDHFG